MAQSEPLYRRLACLVSAMEHCERRFDREEQDALARAWYDKHEQTIIGLCRECLPHGSGFDVGVTLSQASTPEKLIFNVPYHPMSEHGYYIAWQYYTAIVTASLAFGMAINVKRHPVQCGKFDRNTADYIAETMQDALTAESPDETGK